MSGVLDLVDTSKVVLSVKEVNGIEDNIGINHENISSSEYNFLKFMKNIWNRGVIHTRNKCSDCLCGCSLQNMAMIDWEPEEIFYHFKKRDKEFYQFLIDVNMNELCLCSLDNLVSEEDVRSKVFHRDLFCLNCFGHGARVNNLSWDYSSDYKVSLNEGVIGTLEIVCPECGTTSRISFRLVHGEVYIISYSIEGDSFLEESIHNLNSTIMSEMSLPYNILDTPIAASMSWDSCYSAIRSLYGNVKV